MNQRATHGSRPRAYRVCHHRGIDHPQRQGQARQQMNDLNKILRDIHARANSLALLAQHAAQLDEKSSRKSGHVEDIMQNLSALGCLYSDLLAVARAELVAKMQTPANTQSYTDIHGKDIVPPCMDWLEDGHYWKCDENGGLYCNDYGMDSGDYYACSRYCIGVDANGDGISVWLNCDMQEVEV